MKKKYKKVTETKKITTLKKSLWRLFSEYIRLRDSNKRGEVKCCTCDKVFFWKDPKGRMQAGHFIPQKDCPPLVFNEKNVHGQCSYCNSVGQGSQYMYSVFLKEKYGEDIIDHLFNIRTEYKIWRSVNPKKAFVYERTWLNNKITHYKETIKILMSKKKFNE